MNIEGWKYYNHAAIPNTAPHEQVNMKPIEDGSIWELDEKPLLARWTTDWDYNQKTEFWYIIKDEPFDVSVLKSKRRYEINKGIKNYEVRRIKPEEYVYELLRITIAAYSSWPEKYRPTVDEMTFKENIREWNKLDVFGAFSKDTGRICGYAQLYDHNSYVEFSVLRVEPACEKLAINAAMVNGILEYYAKRFDGKFYINDGTRAIRHETAFQDYLEKYFCFRKAYCKLQIRYKSGFGLLIKILYPFQNLIKGKTGIGNQVATILRMEKIRRNC